MKKTALISTLLFAALLIGCEIQEPATAPTLGASGLPVYLVKVTDSGQVINPPTEDLEGHYDFEFEIVDNPAAKINKSRCPRGHCGPFQDGPVCGIWWFDKGDDLHHLDLFPWRCRGGGI